jgi:hypothetical protein
MSEELEVNAEVETDNPLSRMIDFTQNGEFNKANNVFSDIMNQRMQAALDQERIAIASKLNSEEDEDEDDDDIDPDMEVSDEELDASAEELVDDEDLEDEEEQ